MAEKQSTMMIIYSTNRRSVAENIPLTLKHYSALHNI